MPNNKSTLEQILCEIQRCLDSELYLAALGLSLTIPDICGKAEYPWSGNTTRYINWYNQFVLIKYKPNGAESPYSADMPYLSGEVIYNLRNAFLHSGNPNITKDKIKKERCKIDKFQLKLGQELLGDTSCVCYGANWIICEREYEVNVRLLCMRLCETAQEYYLANKEKFDFFDYSIVYEDKKKEV